MYRFSLTTTWNIPASIDQVWELILDSEQWPTWWKYVIEVKQLQPGDQQGIHNIREYYWKTCLPYQLNFMLCIQQLIPLQLIETDVSGDLIGTGTCQLKSNQDNTTIIHYQWNVGLAKPWMNFIAPFAHPIFKWNHRRVMRAGELSLINKLNQVYE